MNYDGKVILLCDAMDQIITTFIKERRGWPGDSHCRGNDVVCRENEKKTARPHSAYEFEELLLAAPFSLAIFSIWCRHSHESGNLQNGYEGFVYYPC
jgi:hypothetical protein